MTWGVTIAGCLRHRDKGKKSGTVPEIHCLRMHARIFQISEYPSNLPCNGDVNIFIVNYNNINVSIVYYTMQSNTTIINIHDYNTTKEIIQYFISKIVKATPTKID